MIRRLIIIVTTALALSFAPALPALASSSTTTTMTTTTPAQRYHAALKAWRTARTEISTQFAASVKDAHKALAVALKANSSSASHIIAREAFRLAVVSAVAARSSALVDLGPRPIPPE